MRVVRLAAALFTLVACLALGAAQAGALTFTPPVHYRVGGHPGDLVSGDLNGDGLPDLVTIGGAGDSIAILSATGNGRFAAPVLVPAGHRLRSLALGDLNGDQAPDVVATGEDLPDDVVIALLGRGDGSFVLKGAFPVTDTLFGVTIGDVTGDGRADVVAGGALGPEVLTGDGAGGLSAATRLPSGSGSYSVVLEDFNGDGHLDVAATRYEWEEYDGFAVLLSDGAGGFLPPVDYRGGLDPADLVTLDLNVDGIPDLVSFEQLDGSGEVGGFLGDGSGAFIRVLGTQVNPPDEDMNFAFSNMAVGDIDHNGRTDLVTAARRLVSGGHYVTPVLAILYGQSDGVYFTHGTMPAGRMPGAIVLDDFNGDGKDDLATADYETGSVSVRIKGTLPTLTRVSPVSGKAGQVVTLTGGHFLKYRRTGEVRFGGAPVTTYVSWSNTAIKVRVPVGTPKRLVNVTVTSIIGRSKAKPFLCR